MTIQDQTWIEPISEAAAYWKQTNGKNPHEASPYLGTSEMDDAFIIACHCLYWTSRAPSSLHKSRGHSWTFEIQGRKYCVRVDNRADHRHGVLGMVDEVQQFAECKAVSTP